MTILEWYYQTIREFLEDHGMKNIQEGREHSIIGYGKIVRPFQQIREFAHRYPEIIRVVTARELQTNKLVTPREGYPVGMKTTKLLAQKNLLDNSVTEDLLSLKSDVAILGDRISFLAMSDASSYTSCMSVLATYPRRESIMQWIDSQMVVAVQIDRKTAKKTARQLIWLTENNAVVFPLYGGAGSSHTILGLETWLKDHGYIHSMDMEKISVLGEYWNDQPIVGWSKKPNSEHYTIDVSELICPVCGDRVNPSDIPDGYHEPVCPACAGYVQCEACGEWVENLEETYDGYNLCYNCMDYRTTEVRVLYP